MTYGFRSSTLPLTARASMASTSGREDQAEVRQHLFAALPVAFGGSIGGKSCHSGNAVPSDGHHRDEAPGRFCEMVKGQTIGVMMTDWVSSTGVPLICIEKRVAGIWRGIYGLSASGEGAANDYERACQVRTFTTTIPLADGSNALVLGDEAMDTMVRIKDGQIFMLRVAACEDDFDGHEVLEKLDPSFFSKTDKEMMFIFSSSPLVLFDSSCP